MGKNGNIFLNDVFRGGLLKTQSQLNQGYGQSKKGDGGVIQRNHGLGPEISAVKLQPGFDLKDGHDEERNPQEAMKDFPNLPFVFGRKYRLDRVVGALAVQAVVRYNGTKNAREELNEEEKDDKDSEDMMRVGEMQAGFAEGDGDESDEYGDKGEEETAEVSEDVYEDPLVVDEGAEPGGGD